MNVTQAKEIRLSDLLLRLGYEIAYKKKGGNEFWYCSPLRIEKEPSFHINVSRNIWYDFGLGEGGNILDFVMHHEHTDLSGALKFLDRIWSGGVIPHRAKPSIPTKPSQNSEPNITFVRTFPTISEPLKAYADSRKIPIDQAHHFIKEVIFKVGDKEQFALGMQNAGGGWELRSSIFKGCIPPKDMTFIESSIHPHKSLSLFEGMFDFLSLICWQYPRPIQGTSIILHTTSNVLKLKSYLEKHPNFEKIYTFFDNDEAGERAYQQLQEMTNISILPKNSIYKPYKDVSEWWQWIKEEHSGKRI